MTAEVPEAPSLRRQGAIMLARHGEPALSRKVKLTAAQYAAFWAEYETKGLVPGQIPPPALSAFAVGAGTLISSTRLRSIESCEKLAGGRTFARHVELIEAPLPPPRFPGFIRLSPKIWGFITRFWWWFFNHHDGQESRRQAEARADAAAQMLEGLTADGEDVLLLAHGFFNFMVGRALRKRGWKLTAGEGYKYWSTRRFERL